MKTRVPVARVRGVCEKCGAEQELSDELAVRVCVHCGGRVRSEGTALSDRRHASQEILEASRIVSVVRFWIGGAGLLFLLATIVSIRDLSTPNGLTSFTGVALSGVLLLASVMGFRLAPFHPFAATVALSLVGTATVLWGLAEGQFALFPIFFTFGFLGCIRPMRRATRALHASPDLIAARGLLGIEVRRGTDAGALLHSATRRAWLRGGLTAAILLGLVSIGSYVAWMQRPRDLDIVLRAFTEAWNGSGTDPVIAFFPADEREREYARFEERLRQLPSWPYNRPRIAAPSSIAEDSEPVQCSFSLAEWSPGAELETVWRETRGVWVLAELRVRVPQGK